MCHGLDVSLHNGTAVAGDNRGRLHFLDPRQDKPFAAAAIHKKDKVAVSVVDLVQMSIVLEQRDTTVRTKHTP